MPEIDSVVQILDKLIYLVLLLTSLVTTAYVTWKKFQADRVNQVLIETIEESDPNVGETTLKELIREKSEAEGIGLILNSKVQKITREIPK